MVGGRSRAKGSPQAESNAWRSRISCTGVFPPTKNFLKYQIHAGATQLHHIVAYIDLLNATMAPKKSKKTADSINSRLALVMKSGMYFLAQF